jgi:hypothetical protein
MSFAASLRRTANNFRVPGDRAARAVAKASRRRAQWLHDARPATANTKAHAHGSPPRRSDSRVRGRRVRSADLAAGRSDSGPSRRGRRGRRRRRDRRRRRLRPQRLRQRPRRRLLANARRLAPSPGSPGRGRPCNGGLGRPTALRPRRVRALARTATERLDASTRRTLARAPTAAGRAGGGRRGDRERTALRRRRGRAAGPRPPDARARSPPAPLVEDPRPVAPRTPCRHGCCGQGLRGRRPDGGIRHQHDDLRVARPAEPEMARPSARAVRPRRNGCGGRRHDPRLRRRRSAARDDPDCLRLRSQEPGLAPPTRPSHAAARSCRRGRAWTRLRDRGRDDARPRDERRERVPADQHSLVLEAP